MEFTRLRTLALKGIDAEMDVLLREKLELKREVEASTDIFDQQIHMKPLLPMRPVATVSGPRKQRKWTPEMKKKHADRMRKAWIIRRRSQHRTGSK